MYYRIHVTSDDHVADIDAAGHNNTVTGFWTPHLDLAVEMYYDAKYSGKYQSTNCVVSTASEDELTLLEDFSEYKSGHSPYLDRDEVFATDVRSSEDVTEFVEELADEQRPEIMATLMQSARFDYEWAMGKRSL